MPPAQPPTYVHYGGIAGDETYERLDADATEERLGFTLSALLLVAAPELQRVLPLENLPESALPPELTPPVSLKSMFADAIREGRGATESVFVAPDEWDNIFVEYRNVAKDGKGLSLAEFSELAAPTEYILPRLKGRLQWSWW